MSFKPLSVVGEHHHLSLGDDVREVVYIQPRERKKAGPRNEPWGTPDVTGKSRKVAPSTLKRWRRSQRYASRNLLMNCSCLTLSKALDVSKYTQST